ncbi:MAG: hypothetical protein DWQ19_10455 [Crenarchaeota archaeon]|mgnify:CR=1 FL=1|nr:MAG: hypothetical protein DWQ19_10455 [Thermoproteota archaeon]
MTEKQRKTIEENGFIYWSDYPYLNWEVHYKNPNDENVDREYLGTLRFHKEKSQSWSFYSIGSSFELLNTPNNVQYHPTFQTKEQAARALLIARRSISANLLPDKLRNYIKERAKDLRREHNSVLGKVTDLHYEMLTLEHLGKEYNLNFDFGVNPKQEVADLKKFLNENMDAIYDHFGKDFGRALRAHIASVVRLVDPEAILDM